MIEPVFEANFQNQLYGFRPKCSAAQAVRAVDRVLLRGWWVVDADIRGYFDAIDHNLLLTLVSRRVSDRRVLKAAAAMVEAGVMEEGQWRATEIMYTAVTAASLRSARVPAAIPSSIPGLTLPF